MPGLLPTFDRGPLTFAANVNIPGGSLVEPDGTTTRIKLATADTAVCLGVALGDAAAYNYAPEDSLDPWGNSIANMNSLVPNEVAVAYQGVFKLKNADTGVTGAGAILFGQFVMSAGAGEVKPFAGTNYSLVIGRCVEPAGIALNARGKIALRAV